MGTAPVGVGGVTESSSASLVLDDGERVGKKAAGVGRGAPEAKTAMALKNHSEAERRRRERINSHLATLRTMLPCSDKMDKAAILAQVINHVKELKSKAVEISKGYNIPSDTDEVRVEAEANAVNSGSFYIRATLCCEDRPEIFAELRRTLDTLQLKTIRAEISTLSGRVKNILIMRCGDNANDIDRHIYAASVHQALKSVLDRVNSTVDFFPRAKRRRISMFESSCSSS